MVRPTHNPHASFGALRSSFSLSFIKTEKKKKSKTGLMPKERCFGLRTYTLQETLPQQSQYLIFQEGAVDLDNSLSKNNRQKSQSINLTYFSYGGKKNHYMVVGDILSSPNEIFLKVSHNAFIFPHRKTPQNIVRVTNSFVDELIHMLKSSWVLNSTFRESCGTAQEGGLEISLVYLGDSGNTLLEWLLMLSSVSK